MQSWDRLLSTLPGQQPGAMPAQARHQSTSGHLSMWKPLCTAFMHVHKFYCANVITYPQIHVYTSLGTIVSLAISGHQGSSLSLALDNWLFPVSGADKWLCASASLKTPYTQLHSGQGEATPPVIGVPKLDQGHGAKQHELSLACIFRIRVCARGKYGR